MGPSASKATAIATSCANTRVADDTTWQMDGIPDPERFRGCDPSIDTLIDRCTSVPSLPVGAAERTLVLAQQALALLDDPTLQDRYSQPFSEHFKWSVLSMLRRCSFCQAHCPQHAQAKIFPPLRGQMNAAAVSTLAASGAATIAENDLLSACILERFPASSSPTASQSTTATASSPAAASAAPSEKSPAMMRYCCDSCMSSIFVDRYRAMSKELALVERRTHGLSSGSHEFELVDGDERNLLLNPNDSSGVRLPGITEIQSSIVVTDDNGDDNNNNNNNNKKTTSSSSCERVIISSIALGTSRLSDSTFVGALKCPLRSLKITVDDSNTAVGNTADTVMGMERGSWAKILADSANRKNPPAALATLRHLEVRGRSRDLIGVKNVLPLRCFTALETLTVNGFYLQPDDLEMLSGAADGKNGTAAMPPLRSVVLSGAQPASMTVDLLLRTVGRLPLDTLSMAFLRVSEGSLQLPAVCSTLDEQRQQRAGNHEDNDDDDGSHSSKKNRNRDRQREVVSTVYASGCRDMMPILVSRLVLWNSGVSTINMANILLRSSLLQVLDISETNIDLAAVLSVAANAGLSLLRVLRANGVTPPLLGTFSNQFPPHLETDSWASLASLSTLHLALLVKPQHKSGLSLFATLPSVTSVDVSFSSASDDIGDFLSSLAAMRTLTSLNIVFPDYARTIRSNIKNSGVDASAKSQEQQQRTNHIFSSLRKLSVKGVPDPMLASATAPRLEELAIDDAKRSSSQYITAAVVSLLESMGQNVSTLWVRADGLRESDVANSNRLGLPITCMPRLQHLHLLGHMFMHSEASVDKTLQLLRGATKLQTLNLCRNHGIARLRWSDLPSSSGALEQSLHNSASLTALDVSHTFNFVGFLPPAAPAYAHNYSLSYLSLRGTNDIEPLVLPSLRRFWYRFSRRAFSGSNRPAFATGQVCPDLFGFLAAQPSLELIDVQGAFFQTLWHAPERFWKAIRDRNKLQFLNMIAARASEQEAEVAASGLFEFGETPLVDSLPDSMKVTRFSAESLSQRSILNFAMCLINAKELRCVWIAVPSSDMIQKMKEMHWHTELAKTAVQINFCVEEKGADEWTV